MSAQLPWLQEVGCHADGENKEVIKHISELTLSARTCMVKRCGASSFTLINMAF